MHQNRPMTKERLIFYAMTILGISISACQKEVEKRVEVPAYYNAFGKSFVIKPLADATDTEREASQAILRVETFDGSGSGFFISPDGLFMTNFHVVSKSHCQIGRCPSVRVVRQASSDGEMVFYDFIEPVLFSEDYDVAILRAKIASNEKTPFLKIDEEGSKNIQIDSPIAAFGHPSGGPLKITPLEMEALSGLWITTKGPIFWGNSGGPLIDLQTQKVLGLVSQITVGSDMIQLDGTIAIRSLALRMNQIGNMVREVYPSFNTLQSISLEDFKNPRNNKPLLRKARLVEPQIPQKMNPPPVATKGEDNDKGGHKDRSSHKDVDPISQLEEITLSSLVGKYWALDTEELAMDRLLEQISTKEDSNQKLASFISSLESIQFQFLRIPSLSSSAKEKIAQSIQSLDSHEDRLQYQILWDRVLGKISQPHCEASPFVREQVKEISEFRRLTYCGSTQTTKGVDFLAMLSDYLQSDKVPETKKLEIWRMVNGVVSRRLLVAPILALGRDQKSLENIFSWLHANAPNIASRFKIEWQLALSQRAPSRLGYGIYAR